MPEPVLDAVALRVMAFAQPRGIEILLEALGVSHARLPAEVYDRDEDALPLADHDEMLSEVARGLRSARRRVQELPASSAERFQRWLTNAAQLPQHFEHGRLLIDRLTIEELARRLELETRYQIGRGEAACLVLGERYGAAVVFLSSDERACRSARELGIAVLTLSELLTTWVQRIHPDLRLLDELLTGMRNARFGLKQAFIDELRAQI